MINEKKLNLIPIKLLCDERVILETLQRIGIGDRKNKILYPSCYLYKNETDLFICHFKEILLLTRENAFNNISNEDISRRNSIIYCLSKWGLLEVDLEKIKPYDKFVFVLSHRNKSSWSISHKITYRYEIGE
jgi:hypothetical protein